MMCSVASRLNRAPVSLVVAAAQVSEPIPWGMPSASTVR
jgi:hypothetical protein